MTYLAVTQRPAVPWFGSSEATLWSSSALDTVSFDDSSSAVDGSYTEHQLLKGLSDSKNKLTRSTRDHATPINAISEITHASATPPSARHTWNFSGTGLKESEVSPYLQNPPPKAIYFFRNNELALIPAPSELKSADGIQYLFVSDLETIQDVQKQREEQAQQAQKEDSDTRTADSDGTGNDADHDRENSSEKKLPENAFEIVSFTAGKRDDGSTLVPTATNLLQALQGPDYSLEPFDWRNDDEMKAHLSRVLSFGHGGELMLKVSGQGYIKNQAGFDFALYENAFRTGSGLNVVQEFARVGVSNSLDEAFQWFPCDPLQNILSGCLGAVPTAEGGDLFDLAVLGLTEARYIKIQDLGINKNNRSRWPTEGCDLDAVRLFHAYTQE